MRVFPLFDLCWRINGPTDGPTNGQTDKASYRVACPQLKTIICKHKKNSHVNLQSDKVVVSHLQKQRGRHQHMRHNFQRMMLWLFHLVPGWYSRDMLVLKPCRMREYHMNHIGFLVACVAYSTPCFASPLVRSLVRLSICPSVRPSQNTFLTFMRFLVACYATL